MYNHQVARFQVDDVYWFLAVKWATPNGFDRSVEFGAYATWYVGRHSGPVENPDDCYLKDIIFGVAPYDVVGVSTLEWWHTDPTQWQSIWAFVPTIRRVRRLTASNSSEGMFGSIIARDDVYGWGGKIQYMNWGSRIRPTSPPICRLWVHKQRPESQNYFSSRKGRDFSLLLFCPLTFSDKVFLNLDQILFDIRK